MGYWRLVKCTVKTRQLGAAPMLVKVCYTSADVPIQAADAAHGRISRPLLSYSSPAAPPEHRPPSRAVARSRRARLRRWRPMRRACGSGAQPPPSSVVAPLPQLSHARRFWRARSAAPLTRTLRCCSACSVCVVSASLPPCGQTFVKATVGHLKEKSARVRAPRRAGPARRLAPRARHSGARRGARRAYRTPRAPSLRANAPRCSPQLTGAKPSYDFYASFEVLDAAKDEVTVAVMQPGPFGASGAAPLGTG